MTELYPCRDQVADDDKVTCDNCSWTGIFKELGTIKDAEQRLDPGCDMPAGECPECGALAYLVETPDFINPRLDTQLLLNYRNRAQLYLRNLPRMGSNPVSREEVAHSFQRGMAAATVQILELILDEHNRPVKTPPDYAEAFQALLAALRAADEPKRPSGTPGNADSGS